MINVKFNLRGKFVLNRINGAKKYFRNVLIRVYFVYKSSQIIIGYLSMILVKIYRNNFNEWIAVIGIYENKRLSSRKKHLKHPSFVTCLVGLVKW